MVYVTGCLKPPPTHRFKTYVVFFHPGNSPPPCLETVGTVRSLGLDLAYGDSMVCVASGKRVCWYAEKTVGVYENRNDPMILGQLHLILGGPKFCVTKESQEWLYRLTMSWKMEMNVLYVSPKLI